MSLGGGAAASTPSLAAPVAQQQQQLPQPPGLEAARERLRVLSSKHAKLLRPKSVDLLNDVLASVSTSLVLPSSSRPPSVLDPFSPATPAFTGSPPQPQTQQQVPAEGTREHFEIADTVAAALLASSSAASESSSALPAVAASPTCPCVTVIVHAAPSAIGVDGTLALPSDPSLCALCHRPLAHLRPMLFDKLTQLTLLLDKLADIQTAILSEAAQSREATRLMLRIEDLAVLIDSFVEDCARHNGDLDILNDKMKDEIARKADLEKDIEVLKDELEELTTSLIKEANVLVADETRQRQALEEREKELEQNLQETRDKLKREQVQLQELKAKMENEYATIIISNQTDFSSKQLKPVDTTIFSDFKEFVALAPNTKVGKISNIRFMHNIIDDDVTPTLRFGGNPRTSTRKLLDSISADLLIVQEMDTLQFSNWLSVNQTLKETLNARIQAVSEARSNPHKQLEDSPAVIAGSNSVYMPVGSRSRTSSEIAINFPPLPKDASKALLALNAIANTPTHSVFSKSMAERVSAWTGSVSNSDASSNAPANTSAGANMEGLLNVPAFFVLDGCSTCGKIGPVQHHFKIIDPASLTQLAAPAKSAPPPMPTPSSSSSTTNSTASGAERISTDGSTQLSVATASTAAAQGGGWVPICENCFDRLDAVARFFEFVRALRSGVYGRREAEEMYREVAGMRRDMFLARVSVGGRGPAPGAAVTVSSAGALRKGRVGSVVSVGSAGLGRQMGNTSRLSSEVL
ncbi:hypothetical protein HDU84_005607 [Entophlyctis sp. JEL0112]|nr:hypothetical protein HDU84_005607 [Entophlyctis sp. JEL0112]